MEVFNVDDITEKLTSQKKKVKKKKKARVLSHSNH